MEKFKDIALTATLKYQKLPKDAVAVRVFIGNRRKEEYLYAQLKIIAKFVMLKYQEEPLDVKFVVNKIKKELSGPLQKN